MIACVCVYVHGRWVCNVNIYECSGLTEDMIRYGEIVGLVCLHQVQLVGLRVL